jgi:hypothetical protein
MLWISKSQNMKNTQKNCVLITAVHVEGASQNIYRSPELIKVQEEVPNQYLVFFSSLLIHLFFIFA